MGPVVHPLLRILALVGLGFVALAVPEIGAATLSGSVTVVPEGRPASGVWIHAVRLGDFLTSDIFADKSAERSLPHATTTARTDARGEFSLSRVPTGTYEVSVTADSLPIWLAAEGRPVQTVIVSKRDQTHVELSVSRQACFEGTARRLAGGALAGARVQAFHKGDNVPFLETSANGRGEFRLPGLERNVAVDLLVTTREGQFRRLTQTPTRAGTQTVEIVMPPWTPTTKRHVIALVTLPSAGERKYKLEWISKPESAETGFRKVVNLDRDGRGEFESPDGVFSARVYEVGGDEREWGSARFYRVDRGSSPLVARVVLEGSL
jgi:hypothetical protein